MKSPENPRRAVSLDEQKAILEQNLAPYSKDDGPGDPDSNYNLLSFSGNKLLCSSKVLQEAL